MFYITATILVGSGLFAGANMAHASCAASSCFLVTGTQEGIANPGQLIMDLSYRYIPTDRPQHGSKSTNEVLAAGIDFATGTIEPEHHRELRTLNELGQLDISYGVTPKFALSLSIPFMNNRYHEHNIDPFLPENYASERTSGMGDLRLTGKYAVHTSLRHLLVAGLGIKTPTGEYKLRNSEGEINEPTLMPGTGAWNGLLSLHYAYQVRPREWDVFIASTYQLTTANSLEYKMGNTLLLNAGTNHHFTVHERGFTSSLQINLRQAPRDEFNNQNVPNTGGTWVYLTPGITVHTTASTAVYTHLQLPLYQNVNDTNLVPSYGLVIGLSQVF
ncbi:MAG: hypothetical protein ABL860_08130 [Candidatus Nitrotoga sp.]